MKIEEEIKGRFKDEFHKAHINIIYTAKQLTYNLLQILKKHDLTEPQYNVLRVLRGYMSEGPVKIAFLKERMLDKSSDVSRIVDKLYSKGYVDRTECASDRRKKDIVITKRGLKILLALDRYNLESNSSVLKLTEEETAELNRLLDKIRD
ncbi:MAG: MarR family transcriptional regulator [Bacteroidales bacterium]|jgi:DNA-binding MarR family transcriptional regulator|nr:MarR family transcriptional regulator [Bacteroidales bacterium]